VPLRLVLVALLGAAAIFPAALVAGTRPTLALATTDGVLVRGTGFRPAELLRVTLTVDGKPYPHRVRASARGRFALRYPGLAIDACTPWRLTARGSLGSRATLLPRASRDCPPPPPAG